MYKYLLPVIAFCLFHLDAISQVSPIMLCNPSGSVCTPYQSLDSAYSYANPGDFIYLPGGIFSLASSINKEVHLIGAGFNADSSLATGTTTMTSASFGANAHNASVEGIYFTSSINGVTTSTINGVSIRYCNASQVSGKFANADIHGCIFRTNNHLDNNFYGGTFNTISNCYITGTFNLSNSQVINNSGLSFACNSILVTYKNNIMSTYLNAPNNQPGSNNTVMFNVYMATCPSFCISTVNASNNSLVASANLFNGTFSSSNMKLIPGSPALTAGEFGSQAGAYGGTFPYKDGAVPSTPHIYYRNIAPSTNANGELPVQIHVRAESY